MRERRGYKKDFFCQYQAASGEKEKERRDREERKEGSILQQQISTKRKRGKKCSISLCVWRGKRGLSGFENDAGCLLALSLPSSNAAAVQVCGSFGGGRGIKFHFSARHGAVCTIWERDAAAAAEVEGGRRLKLLNSERGRFCISPLFAPSLPGELAFPNFEKQEAGGGISLPGFGAAATHTPPP